MSDTPRKLSISQLASTQSQIPQPIFNWQELRDEKRRLEEQLEVETQRLEPLQPILRNGFQPDDEYAFYLPDEVEYGKVCRRIDRFKEEIEMVKERLKRAP